MSLPDEELISAFLDDELSPEERLRAEQLLTERADLRRLLDDLRGLREGLQALPGYALGEDFGSLVMRRAEREMLRGDKPAEQVAAAAPEMPRDCEVPNVDAKADRVELNPADRWRRPAAWALIALAAALVLTFVERGMFVPRDGDVALKPAERPGAPAPAVERKLTEEAGKLGTDRETFSKEGALGGGGFRAKGDAGVVAESRDAKREGAGAPNIATMPKKVGDTASAASNDVAFGVTRKDASGVAGKTISEAEGLADIAGQGALAYGDLAGIAQNDFNRALTIASQLRAMENETESRRVSAVQLQQRLAKVDEAHYRSRQVVAGEVSSQSFSNAAAPAAKGQAMNAAAPAGAARPSAEQVGQGDQVVEKQTLRLNGGAFDQAAAPANSAVLSTSLGRNVLVVTVEGTEEAITKVFAPALRREQIADLNNSWHAGDTSFAAVDSYNALQQSAAPSNAQLELSVGVSNAMMPQDADLARALARRAADKSADDAVKLDVAAKQNVEAKTAGEKSAAANMSGTASNEEYFYVVAPEGSLESALNSLRADLGSVHNLTVEPGPTTPVDESRWSSYNRSGMTSPAGLSKPATTSAVAAAKPPAIPPPAPAAHEYAMPKDARSETAPKSKTAASTTPVPAAAPVPASPPSAPAANLPSSSPSTVANGSSAVLGGIVTKSGAGTLVLGNTVQGSFGENGFSGQTTVSGSAGANVTMNQGGLSAASVTSAPIVETKPLLSFGTGGAVTQQIAPTSPALQAINAYGLPAQFAQQQLTGSQQILPMGRAQRLTSRQLAVLESAAVTAPDSNVNPRGALSQDVSQLRPRADEPSASVQQRPTEVDSLKREAGRSDGAERTLTKNAGETSGGLAGAGAAKSGELGMVAQQTAAQPTVTQSIAAPAPIATNAPAARPGEPVQQQQERAAGQETPPTNPPFVWSFAQSSPPLPADYREAIFVFRVVSPEGAKPVMNDAQSKDATSAPVPLTK